MVTRNVEPSSFLASDTSDPTKHEDFDDDPKSAYRRLRTRFICICNLWVGEYATRGINFNYSAKVEECDKRKLALAVLLKLNAITAPEFIF